MTPLDEAPGGGEVTLGVKFSDRCERVSLDDVVVLKPVAPRVLESKKYKQIVASIAAIGLVEPLVVFPTAEGRYQLIDGHLRVLALRKLGIPHADCLLGTDDDTYSYNKQVNRLGPVQDHHMIAEAEARGVARERISSALGLSSQTVSRKVRLLEGVDPEAAKALGDVHCPALTFKAMKKMRPERQREVAEIMVKQGNVSSPFAEALVAASMPHQLVPSKVRQHNHAGAVRSIAHVERELATLQNNVKSIEKTFGTELLQFTAIKGYIGTLLNNAEVVKWLGKHRSHYLKEFHRICDLTALS
jgi:ParB-like chromosome segregation protein Spo0J